MRMRGALVLLTALLTFSGTAAAAETAAGTLRDAARAWLPVPRRMPRASNSATASGATGISRRAAAKG